MDVLTPEQRQRNMSRIRSRDTKPEMTIRKALHARGYRYRIHDKRLAGTPDIVFSRRRIALFVHGCFWHGHGCSLSKLPATRSEFWAQKIERNRQRDDAALALLMDAGWRVITVWECAIRGRLKLPIDVLLARLEEGFEATDTSIEIAGEAAQHHKC